MTVRDFTFLGTSSQQPTRCRNHNAILLRLNNEGILFDPGEGTQRQFIFANVAPTCVTRIFISHFHGDHCLGLGSMLMRLNLDQIEHPVHCYYPASGQKFFERLRYGTQYHEMIKVVEHPVSRPGIVEDDGRLRIEAAFLEHGVENVAWRLTEPDTRKFDNDKLKAKGVVGPKVKELQDNGVITIDGNIVSLDEVSWIRKGDSFVVVMDTLYCQSAIDISRGAKVLVCESTYLDEQRQMATDHKHLTAKQAATIAKEAGVEKLILTHFSARYQNTNDFEVEARTVFPNSYAAHDLMNFPINK